MDAKRDGEQQLQIWLEAFANLLKKLNQAFNEQDANKETPNFARWQNVNALTAVATFISTFDKLLGAHFFDFASRLNDLDKGRDDDPLFMPAKIWDRHADASDRWRARARAVLAIEALIATGSKPKQAIDAIAEFSDLCALAGPRATASLATVLRNWRKEFMSCRVSDIEAALLFDEGCKRIKELKAADRRDEILAIAENVDRAAKLGGVLSPPRPTKK